MKTFSQYLITLNELAYSEKSHEQAITRAIDYISKKLEKPFLRKPDKEYFENKWGNQTGIRYIMGGTTNSIRFNFDETYALSSIDYWGSDGASIPLFHVITKGISLAQILPQLVELMRTEELHDIEIIDPGLAREASDEPRNESKEILTEKEYVIGKKTYSSGQEAVMALLKPAKTPEQIADAQEKLIAAGLGIGTIYASARALGITINTKVLSGSPEINKDPNIAKAQQALSVVKYADPKVIFDDIEKLVTMVIKGFAKSVVVAGMSGIGKTYTVTDVINKAGLKEGEGEDWYHVKGFSTTRGLYLTLFLNRKSLIVYDDCDSILKDPEAANVLKGALDSYDKRTIHWGATRGTFRLEDMEDDDAIAQAIEEGMVPKKFDFEGSVIFISNLPISKMDDAVIGRASAAVDVWLKTTDIIARMETILHKISPKADMEHKKKALAILKANSENREKQLTIRTLINAIGYIQAGFDNSEDLIKRYS